MEIDIYREFTEFDNAVMLSLIRMSELMKDAGEEDYAVVATVYGLLTTPGAGCFFVIKNSNSQDIAYGAFANGVDNTKFRRLTYLAVETKYRGSGLGHKALLTALDAEVDKSKGCSVACPPKLEDFYSKLGFVACQETSGYAGKNEIVMVLPPPLIENPCKLLEGQIITVQIDPESSKAFLKNIKEALKNS
ncbi:MAG: GNAT family N-acetyltransferase [Motiliproteus sp.]|nr:GNAT family N-acetyltransferase [Motiliproteus sp.]MCW9053291.1 GNAT family N-acetyltransferase [Motiliproteus sp.]